MLGIIRGPMAVSGNVQESLGRLGTYTLKHGATWTEKKQVSRSSQPNNKDTPPGFDSLEFQPGRRDRGLERSCPCALAL